MNAFAYRKKKQYWEKSSYYREILVLTFCLIRKHLKKDFPEDSWVLESKLQYYFISNALNFKKFTYRYGLNCVRIFKISSIAREEKNIY